MNKPEITNKKLEELKQLAEAATPGPWRYRENNAAGYDIESQDDFIVYSGVDSDYECEYGCEKESNAAYIAAASPDFILAVIEDDMQLLRKNRRLSNEITKLNKMVDWFAAKMPLSELDDNRQECIDRWKREARNMTR